MRATAVALLVAVACAACAAPQGSEPAQVLHAGDRVLDGRITMMGNAPFAQPVLQDRTSGQRWELRGLSKDRAAALLDGPVRVVGKDLSLDRAPGAFGLPALQVRAIEKIAR